MKRITFIVPALLVMSLAGGCIVTGTARVHGRAHVAAPTLVYVSPGVQVVEDYDEPVFYSDGYYWRYYGNTWYRSSYHTGGWVHVSVVPHRVRGIDRPHTYVHYRARGNAYGHGQVRGNDRARVRDHRSGGGNTTVRGRNDGRGARDHRGGGDTNVNVNVKVKGRGKADKAKGRTKGRDHR